MSSLETEIGLLGIFDAWLWLGSEVHGFLPAPFSWQEGNGAGRTSLQPRAEFASQVWQEERWEVEVGCSGEPWNASQEAKQEELMG